MKINKALELVYEWCNDNLLDKNCEPANDAKDFIGWLYRNGYSIQGRILPYHDDIRQGDKR